MSKASEYADAWAKAYNLRPPEVVLVTLGANKVGAKVEEGGKAMNILGYSFSPAEALRLRDWLTDTFDEVTPAPGATGSEGRANG